jgi:exodeoxyribonuclease V beta subunit
VLPIRGGYEPTRPLSCQQLATCFDEPLASLVAGLAFLPVTGFLEGRLDLIFEHDGRFHLLDWKSNKLGKRWSDYAGPRLEVAMTKAGYHLQAQLYALALHKLLEQRLGASYRFDEHFGEIIYAFVRGMSPETGARCGVWRNRPTLLSLQKLEATLKEAS